MGCASQAGLSSQRCVWSLFRPLAAERAHSNLYYRFGCFGCVRRSWREEVCHALTYLRFLCSILARRLRILSIMASLINLNRPTAYHNDPNLPSHTFRPGDPAKIVPQESVRSKTKTKKSSGEEEREVEGVVYKVCSTGRGEVKSGQAELIASQLVPSSSRRRRLPSP